MKNILIIAVLLLLTGCSLFKGKTNIVYFNIGTPIMQNTSNLGLTIKPINSDLPFGKKMTFITSEYSMTSDSFNKWSQTPEELVYQYVESYFNNPAKKLDNKTNNKYILNIQIIRFACYSTKPEISLQLNILISDNKTGKILLNKSFIQNFKFNKLTADSIAEAMSKGVNNICSKIKIELLELNNKSKSTKK
jgi:hypothetical protein